MNTLIVKLGATGDVVRTTPLLHGLGGTISWLTEARNTVILRDVHDNLRTIPWPERGILRNRRYDLVVNLEDTLEVAEFIKTLEVENLWGAYVDSEHRLSYTEDSRQWFDLSIVSKYGRQQADKLKFNNRRSYQELIFDCLGLQFTGQPYFLPNSAETELRGDVAIASDAGPVWPMKKWAYYEDLKKQLEDQGLTVNVLPARSSLLEHLGDVQNHRCLVSGDSLPMHLALGSSIPCVSIFTCTSPWEIHGYDLQKQIVSPLLEEFFYKRGYDGRATSAITVDEVLDAVMTQFKTPATTRAVLAR